MRTFFLVLVALVTVVGMFVENSDVDAAIVKAYVENAYNYVTDKANENPEQVVASAMTMTLSTIIWLSILRITRDNNVRKITVSYPLPKIGTNTELDSPALSKAKARQLYNQLQQDKAILEGRQKWFPEEIERTKQELVKAQQDVRTTKAQYDIACNNADSLQKKLDNMLDESDRQYDEIHEIDDELERLSKLI